MNSSPCTAASRDMELDHDMRERQTQEPSLQSLRHSGGVGLVSSPTITIDSSEPQILIAKDGSAPRRSGRLRKTVQYAYSGDSASDPLEDIVPKKATKKKTKVESRRKVKKTAVATRAIAPKPISKALPKRPSKKASKETPTAALKKIRKPVSALLHNTESSVVHDSIAEHFSRYDAALTLLQLSQSSSGVDNERQLPHDAVGDEDWSVESNAHKHGRVINLKQHKMINAPAVKALDGAFKPTSLDVASTRAEEKIGTASDGNTLGNLMPSAANDYKFQTAGTSKRTTKQLDALLKVPARPKKFPLDLASGHAMKLSYYQTGSKPPKGLAEKLVQEAEARHALEIKGWDDSEE